MAYMPRTADKRRDSRLPFEGATSAIVVAMDYGGASRAGPSRDTRAATTITT